MKRYIRSSSYVGMAFERYPLRIFSTSPEKQAEIRRLRKEFLDAAEIGDVFEVVGYDGANHFKVVTDSKGKNGMGLRWIDSGNSRVYPMNNANIDRFISTGCTLVERTGEMF